MIIHDIGHTNKYEFCDLIVQIYLIVQENSYFAGQKREVMYVFVSNVK